MVKSTNPQAIRLLRSPVCLKGFLWCSCHLQGIDDGKVFLGTEAREGYAEDVLGRVRQKGWAWGNWSGMIFFVRGEITQMCLP